MKTKTKKPTRKRKANPIDKVTVTNLDIALRMCNIGLSRELIDKIIDLVELIEDKGDDTTIKDICKLQAEWVKFKALAPPLLSSLTEAL